MHTAVWCRRELTSHAFYGRYTLSIYNYSYSNLNACELCATIYPFSKYPNPCRKQTMLAKYESFMYNTFRWLIRTRLFMYMHIDCISSLTLYFYITICSAINTLAAVCNEFLFLLQILSAYFPPAVYS